MIRKLAIISLVTACLPSLAQAQHVLPGATEAAPRAEPRPTGPYQAEPATATVPGQFYAGGSLGPVFYRDNEIGAVDLDFESGGQLSGFGGIRVGVVRLEVEMSSQGGEFDPSNSVFDGDFSLFRAAVGGYLDIVTIEPGWVDYLRPYVGGGLGVAVADIEGFDDDDAGFTFHGELGVSFPIWQKIEGLAAYRYERTDLDEFEDDLEAHSIRAGARYNF